ncbi:hypothetical protein NAPIS_ORF01779 [Vairimorpha apis BRL 01]|uniref:Uncharacterized protein n=1 Tax=Vairimorpha apis BRL 01 TaxID=1037528 RepID=T0MBT1_9MICR|nr:hypothetical protein NAPIS_ORF01779 [Vairimorpha apis BRL 01]
MENKSENSDQTHIQSHKGMLQGKTFRRGRFLIEDYSECIVKDYNTFLYKIMNYDSKRIVYKNDKIKNLVKILEIQNKQIRLLKTVLPIDTGIDKCFDLTCDEAEQLLKEFKDENL